MALDYVVEQLQRVGRRDSRMPRYLHLRDVILGAIESGLWRPGDRLPSQSEFARTMPLSLGTVQKAIDALIEQGVVISEHGRGTFVAGVQHPKDELWHARFLDSDGGSLLPVYSRVIRIERSENSGPWSQLLSAEAGFVCIVRLLDVGRRFRAYNEFYLGLSRFASLLNMRPSELDGVPLRTMLSKRFNAPTLRTAQHVHCGPFPAVAVRALRLPRKTCGLCLEVSGYSYRDAPITYQRLFAPPTEHRLEVPG